VQVWPIVGRAPTLLYFMQLLTYVHISHGWGWQLGGQGLEKKLATFGSTNDGDNVSKSRSDRKMLGLPVATNTQDQNDRCLISIKICTVADISTLGVRRPPGGANAQTFSPGKSELKRSPRTAATPAPRL